MTSGMEASFRMEKASITISGARDKVPVNIYQFDGIDCTVAVSVKEMALSPQSLVDFLDVLPNKAVVEQLIVLASHPHEKRHLSASSDVDAFTERARIYLVNPGPNQATTNALLHAWSHILFDTYKREARMFALGAEIQSAESTDTELSELWAKLFTDLLADRSYSRVGEIANSLPLCALAIALAMKRTLATTFSGPSTNHARYEQISTDLQLLALVNSRAVLSEIISADQKSVQSALKLMFYFGLDEAQVLASVRELDLSHEYFIDSDLGLLALCRDLRQLDLSGTAITRSALNMVPALPDLEQLIVSHTQVSKLSALSKLQSLRKIDLSATEVSDNDIVHLTKLPNLAEVCLKHSQVTEKGRAMLAELNPSLQIDL